MNINFSIPGKPIAKKRPRFVKKTGIVFDPNATEEGRAMVFIIEHIRKIKDFSMFVGPLSVKFTFVFERPKSHYGTGKNLLKLKKHSPVHCTNRTDLDNMEKFICDAMNGIVYKDDSQIIESLTKKQWGNIAKTVVEVSEIK